MSLVKLALHKMVMDFEKGNIEVHELVNNKYVHRFTHHNAIPTMHDLNRDSFNLIMNDFGAKPGSKKYKEWEKHFNESR